MLLTKLQVNTKKPHIFFKLAQQSEEKPFPKAFYQEIFCWIGSQKFKKASKIFNQKILTQTKNTPQKISVQTQSFFFELIDKLQQKDQFFPDVLEFFLGENPAFKRIEFKMPHAALHYFQQRQPFLTQSILSDPKFKTLLKKAKILSQPFGSSHFYATPKLSRISDQVKNATVLTLGLCLKGKKLEHEGEYQKALIAYQNFRPKNVFWCGDTTLSYGTAKIANFARIYQKLGDEKKSSTTLA